MSRFARVVVALTLFVGASVETAQADVAMWPVGNKPSCLFAIAASGGNVYTLNPDRPSILQFDAFGGSKKEFVSQSDLYPAINTDGAGNVYVYDTTEVHKYSPEGTSLASFPVTGAGGGHHGIAVDSSGNVYVATGQTIQKYQADGTLLTQWGSLGSGPGQFRSGNAFVIGMTVGTNGDLYVADGGNGRVQEFTSDGAYVRDWGSYGSGPGEFIFLTGVAAAPDGSIYVSDGGGNGQGGQLQRFDAGGHFLGSFKTIRLLPSGYTAVATTADAVYALNCSQNTQIWRVDSVVPVAPTNFAPDKAQTDEATTLDASSALVPFSSISSYEFDTNGDGVFDVSSTSPIVSFEPASAGVLPIKVRVTSASGGTAEASEDIAVSVAPPDGRVGISINGGDVATNDRDVKVSLVWPKSTTEALLSNDGGFGNRQSDSRALAPEVNWRLETSGAERLPKTVYARFLGTGAEDVTHTDDIILDERPPEVVEAEAQGASKARGHRVNLVAEDDNSGVSSAQFATSKHGKKTTVRFTRADRKGARKLDRTVNVHSSAKPRFVRVSDAAGSFSGWRAIK